MPVSLAQAVLQPLPIAPAWQVYSGATRGQKTQQLWGSALKCRALVKISNGYDWVPHNQ